MTNNDNSDIWYEHGGDDGPLLVLLHGLGANAAVWDGLKPIVAARWPGRWIIPRCAGWRDWATTRTSRMHERCGPRRSVSSLLREHAASPVPNRLPLRARS
ncbi:MAG TPA: hypothetical protein PL143_09970 [Rhodocyclaceae bacterium]|nr:hypothetical protein [Rhodocyclaceae bacterium]